jgi:hypothetical protein
VLSGSPFITGLLSVVNEHITGTLADGTNSVGTTGQVLESTGTGTVWTTLGVLPQTFSPVANEFLTGYNATSGVFSAAQPSAANLSNGVTGTGAVVLAAASTLTGAVSIVGPPAAPTSLNLSNTTAATVGSTNDSPQLFFTAQYWTGSASAQDTWEIQQDLSAGANGSSTLVFLHSGSSGAAAVQAPIFDATTGFQVNGSALAFSNLSGTATNAQIPGAVLLSPSGNQVITAHNLNLASGTVLGFNSDTGISRLAAGTFAFGNGTAGDISATIEATTPYFQEYVWIYNQLGGGANLVLATAGTGSWRNWAIGTGERALGDMGFVQSNAAGGSPLAGPSTVMATFGPTGGLLVGPTTGGGLDGGIGTIACSGVINVESNAQSMIGSIAFITSASPASVSPSIRSTAVSGGLVLNSGGANPVYLNYDSGTGGVDFCNGAGTATATMSSAGVLNVVAGYSANGTAGVTHAAAAATSLTTEFGLVTVFATSDERLKKDIVPFTKGLAELQNVKPITYRWKDDHTTYPWSGFSAQQVAETIPEASPKLDDDSGMLDFHYQAVLAVAVNAIKELAAKNASLVDDMDSLRAEMAELRAEFKAMKGQQ